MFRKQAASDAVVSGSSCGKNITHSLMFNNTGESVYLERTPSADGNKQVATLSFWIKNCGVSDSGATDNTRIMYAGNSTSNASYWQIMHTSAKFNINNYRSGPGNGYWTTDAQYRDPGAWYHFVVSYNQGTVSTYVNGELQSQSVTIGGWSGAVDTAFNSNGVLMVVGPKTTTASVKSIYLAEYHWIDGQALGPEHFGVLCENTNSWEPIEYNGTYGTNGFYLDFSDAGNIGKDASGNNNDFTPTNLNATDQRTDTPTNNFATMNSSFEVLIANPGAGTYTPTYSNGNLMATNPPASGAATIPIPRTGKWYAEFYITGTSGGPTVGMKNLEGLQWPSRTSDFAAYRFHAYIPNASFVAGKDINNVDTRLADLSAYYNGGGPYELQLAYDADNGILKYYVSGNLVATENSVIPSYQYAFFINNTWNTGGGIYCVNFGQDPTMNGRVTGGSYTDANGYGQFKHQPPEGHLALCTQNLPEPEIVVPKEHFNTVLYTGNGSTLSVSGVGFSADLTWLKNRDTARNHNLTDTVRGVNKYLSSDTSDNERTGAGVQSWTSDGFTLGSGVPSNDSGDGYVAWNWKADNTSGSSNTDGTIASTVSANTTAGFSIVSYTGQSAAGTVGHGLSQAPEMIILKNRDQVAFWAGYVEPLGNATSISINDSNKAYPEKTWNDTSPTSTVFSIGAQSETSSQRFNVAGEDFIAYCFHSVEGYSKIGSYTGNGSTDGPFINIGFRPAFVLVKRTDSTGNWIIMDGEMSPYNMVNKYLFSDRTSPDQNADRGDFVSNGFKIRTTSTAMNSSAAEHVYMAFAESPLKYARGR